MENEIEQKEAPRIVRQGSRSKRILIMGKSDIRGGAMAPTDWGYFQTVGDAEEFARWKIKGTSWAVGEEITKRDAFGKVLEVTYDLATPIFNPRNYGQD